MSCLRICVDGLRKTTETLGQDISRGQDSYCVPSEHKSKSFIVTPLHLVTFPVYFSNILCKQMQTYLRLGHQVENASYI